MSFLWNGWRYCAETFTSLMQVLGIWKKVRKLLLVGIDNTGKTILHRMLIGDERTFNLWIPLVLKPTLQEMKEMGYTFETLQLGGYVTGRRALLMIDTTGLEGIVFLIDASESRRFSESKRELESLLTDERIANIPILVLGNKTDLADAVGEEELREEVGLMGKTTGKGKVPMKDLPSRPLELFMCSVFKKQGYGEGFVWLSQYLDM